MHDTNATTTAGALPLVIQGGMGTGVSGWTLARAVSRAGQLGVVSGTALDTILVRRLQDGDAGGHVRRAMERFPIPGVSESVLRRYFLPDGQLVYRGPAEPVEAYVAKGGDAADTVGRRCLCNGLVANVGHPQARADDAVEAPLVTSGDDLLQLRPFLRGRTRYSALEALDYLLVGAAEPATS